MSTPFWGAAGTMASSASAATFNVGFPGGSAGDLVVLIVCADSTATISVDDPTSRWTAWDQINVGTTFGARAFTTTMLSDDVGNNASVTAGSGGGTILRCGVMHYFSAALTDPPVINARTSGSGTGTVVTIPSISVASSGNYLGVSIVALGDNVLTTPTNSWTERSELVSSAGNDGGICVETKSLTTAGTEASHTRTYSTSNEWVAWSMYMSEPANNSQSLTQSSTFSDGDTFYTQTLTATRALTQSSTFSEGDTFYTPTVVRKLQQLTQSSTFSEGDTYYIQIVRLNQPLTQSSTFNPGDTFYTIQLGWGLKPALFADGDTFYQPTITTTRALTQSSTYTNADTFYTQTLANLLQKLFPPTVSEGDIFYQPTVTAKKDLTPSRYDNSTDTFYGATVTFGNTLVPPRVISTNAFYTHTLVRQQFLTQTQTIAVADVFYLTVVKGFNALTPSRFDDSADTFYPIIAYAKKELFPQREISTNTFPQHAIGQFYLMIPDLFVDGDTFYAPSVSAPPAMGQILTAPQVVSENTFFSPLVQRVGDFVGEERDTTHLARHLNLNVVHALRLELLGERITYLGSMPADAIITGTLVHVTRGFGSGTSISAGYDALYANVIGTTASHTARVVSGGPVDYRYSKNKTLYARLHGDTIDPNGRASIIVHYVPGAE